MIVTNGSLQAFNFVMRRFVERGVRVFVEAPCYDRSLTSSASSGREVEEVPLCDDRPGRRRARRGAGEVDGPSLVYTIPTFQNPSGRTLSEESRRRLLELAREHDALFFEDDPYGLLRFEGDATSAALRARGRGGRHLPLLVLEDRRAGDPCRLRRSCPRSSWRRSRALVLENYVSPCVFVQAALYEFLRRGRFDPNSSGSRVACAAKRDAMLAALEREMPEGTRWNEPEGGYFLWVDLPAGVRGDELLDARRRRPASRSSRAPTSSSRTAARSPLGSRSPTRPPEEIGEGVARLGRLLREAAAVAA